MEQNREEKSMTQDVPPADDQQQEPAEKSVVKPLYKRFWVWLCGGCILLLLLVTFVLPMGAKYYLVDWLQKNGADQAVIDRFGWNPFLGELWLEGVDLSRDGRSMMTQGALDIDIDYAALFDKDIALASASYTGLTLEVEQKADGSWRVATLTLPLPEKAGKDGELSAAAEKKGEDSAAMQGDSEEVRQQVSTAWAFLADNVVLTNCQVHYKTPVFDFMVHVDSAELKRFSTREGSPAGSLLLTGTVNGEPVSVDLHKLQITPALRLAGKVVVSRFDLDALDTLLHDSLPFFGGAAAVNGDVDFSFDDSGITVDYDGTIAVAKADVGADSFRTRADDLRWQGKVRYEMPNDAAMQVITDGLLQGDGYSLQVPSAELDTSEQQVKLSGKTKVIIGSGEGSGVQVDHNGELAVTTIAFALPMLRTTEKSLLWNGHVFYDLAQEHLVTTKGKLDIAAVDYVMPQQPLHIKEENITWQGSLRYQGKNGIKNNDVALNGKLTLAPATVESGAEKEKISALAAALGWEGKISFFQPEQGGNTIETDGALSGEGIEAVLHGNNLSFTEKKLQLASKTTLQLGEKFHIESLSSLNAGSFIVKQPGAAEPVVSLENLVIDKFAGLGGRKMRAESIAADNLRVTVDGNFPLDIKVPAISSGELSTSDLENFVLASLSLTRPEIISRHNDKELAALDDITLTDLQAKVTGEIAADIAGVTLNNLVFLGEQQGKSAASLKQAKLTGLHWSEKEGAVGQDLDFHDLVATIIRDAKGEINIVTELAAMQNSGGIKKQQQTAPAKITAAAAKPAAKGAAAKESSPLKLKLARVHISGNGSIGFTDYTLKVPYQTSLEIDQFQITDLDSTRPGDKSPVKLSGTLEKRAPVTVEGAIWPFAKDIGLDLALKVKNYPLQNLSSYTIQSIGVGLASGELQVESSAVLKERHLKNKNQLLLRKLETKLISKELAKELNKRLPIPLDAALSLLRDKNGAIKLSVPLNGRIDKLHVGLADVIITALEKAVVPALTGYAIYALGPYGALAYAGVKLGEDLLKEKDLPLIFLKGESTLVAEQKKLLDPLGKKMQAEEKGDLQICPIVASWELMSKEEIKAVSGSKVAVASLSAEMQQQLTALGQQRAENIQNYFMQQFSIKKDRLLLCTTVIKEEKKFLPLVALRKE